MTIFDDALATAKAEYDARLADLATADEHLHDSEDARVAAAQAAAAQLADERRAYDALNAEFDAYKARNPESQWVPFHTYDLTRNEGWQINTGARPAVDFSKGRSSMVQFGPDGLRLSAKPVIEGGQTVIASCDVIAKFKPLPIFRAVEMDLEFDGPLGPGLFPAPYWSKMIESNQGGEFDGVEHMGALAGTDMQWKMTAIALPAASPLVQVQKPLVPFFRANGIDPTAKNTWRWEHTDGKVELFINGLTAATITREEFDGPGPFNAKTKQPWWPAKPGRFNAQFQNPALHPYVRSTWQVGPRGDGQPGGMGGVIPKDWTGSSMLISRLVVEALRG